MLHRTSPSKQGVSHDQPVFLIWLLMTMYISADPGLRQGRGGAWDHCRCGTCSVSGPNRLMQLRPGAQAIAIWACHSHLLLRQRSSLPFARLQRPKTLRGSFGRGVRGCPQTPKTRRGSFDQARRPACAPKASNPPPQRRPGTQATAICYYRRSRLPFARPQRPKTLRGTFDQALRSQASATIGVRGCRLLALKGLKRSAAPSTRHSGHSHLLLSAFEAAVCPPSKA